MANYSGYSKDIIDYSDGFKDGYIDGSRNAVLEMQSLVEELTYELGYDEDTRWEIITNLSKKVKNTDFLERLDKDLWGYVRNRM